MRQVGQGYAVQIRKRLASPRPDQPLDRLIRQLLIVAQQVVHRLAHGLTLGDRHLLHRMLKLHARGFQPLGQVRAVQQFERRHPLASQPVLQHPSDQFSGMGGIEVGGRIALGPDVIVRDHSLALDLGRTLGQQGQAGEFHGRCVQGLLGHPHGGGAVVAQHVLGGLGRDGSILGRHQQRPGRGGRLADIDFVVDGTGHDAFNAVQAGMLA
ncbi:hypothetical protein [Brevundimonas sp.]|uniref:hypothetical protein n=1 Tax=Brevundimonas sp. TaxID=1871086 RepID=UPI003A0FFC37